MVNINPQIIEEVFNPPRSKKIGIKTLLQNSYVNYKRGYFFPNLYQNISIFTHVNTGFPKWSERYSTYHMRVPITDIFDLQYHID